MTSNTLIERPRGRPLRHAALLVSFALYLASCSGEAGPQRIAAYGSVRLDGARLKAGQIRFIPSGGTAGPAAAATIENGEYVFSTDDGPILGAHRVEIEAADYLDFPIDDERAFAAFASAGKTRDRRATRNPVPPEYNVRSKLVRSVDAETEPKFDFDLRTAQSGR